MPTWSWFYENNTKTPKLKKPRKPSFTSRSLSNAADVKNPAVLLTMVAWLATYGPSLGSGADYLRMVNVEYKKPRGQARQQRREAAARQRKRTRKRKKIVESYLDELQDMMEAGINKIDREGDPDVVGTTHRDGKPLKHATQHYKSCQHEGCLNTERAPVLCFTCQGAYCLQHAADNQTTDVVVIGSDNPLLKSGQDGGYVLCKDCGSVEEFNKERVLNVGVIATRLIKEVEGGVEHLSAAKAALLNSSKFKGTGQEIISGDDIDATYYAKSNDRPQNEVTTMPDTVNQVPPMKPTLKARVNKDWWLARVLAAGGDDDENSVCPGCGDLNCKMSKSTCKAKYDYGDKAWPRLKDMRTQLKLYLENGETDRAWEYVLSHVTYEAHWENKKTKKGHDIRVFEKIKVAAEVMAARVASGISCAFCQRATYENGLLKIPPAQMQRHSRRSNKCGELMKNAGTNYLKMNDAKTQCTVTLSGPAGAAPTKDIGINFLCLLFSIDERTLRNHTAKKKNGSLGENTQTKRAKAGGSNRLTPQQLSRLEDILKREEFAQTLPHYAPASHSHIYRYAAGVSRAQFWYKYCQLHDLNFYNQCKHFGHKQGLDDPLTRPSDEAYLSYAEDHFNVAETEEVRQVYAKRKLVRDQIKALEQEIGNNNDNGDNGDEGEQNGDENIATRIGDLVLKLKRMPGCHVRADVSYTTALRVYNRYAIKVGRLACDTCKVCDSLRMKINTSQGATKKRLQQEWVTHKRMADEGYKWRKQDRSTAQEVLSSTYTMIIDFGQGLRTPTLSFGAAWYRRVVKVMPYIICGYGANGFNNVTYYVWDETIAKKGADEVISVVHKNILQNLPLGTKHLIIHFDGCFGQANNSPFLSFCADLLDPSSPFHHPSLLRITLKRNPVGHTFCDCDTCHGKVQKTMQRMGGQVHTMSKLAGAPPGVVSWEEVIEAAGYTYVGITQDDILDYTKYLMTKLYKKPTKAVTGTTAARGKWLISKQHMFELGRWDIHVGVEGTNEQERIQGFVRTHLTWKDSEPSRVRIWREKGPKITLDNIHSVRQDMLIHLNSQTSLPERKYNTLFKLCVRKKWDLWKNGIDSGFGSFLSVVYPPLTNAEKDERTRLIQESVDSRNEGEHEDAEEEEE